MKKASFATFVLVATMLVAMFGFVSPIATAQSGVDLTDGSEIALESMGVDLIPAGTDYGTNGAASYNLSVSGTVEQDGLPLIYPVRLTFYDVSGYSGTNTKSALESSNDVTKLEATTTVLSPTQPDSFVPTIRESESDKERIMTLDKKVTLAFPDLIDQDSAQKDVVVIAESIRSNNAASDTDTVDIDGSLPEGFSSSTVQESDDTNILTSVSFVDSYRISGDNENAQFGENLELPSPSDNELSGDVRGFNGMQSPFGNSTVVSGDNNISMITRTGDIPSGRPYTLTVTYSISEGDQVKVRPTNPVGQDITESSEYILPDDASEEDYCREIDADGGNINMCNIYLNEGEVDLTTDLKEILLHYNAEDSTTISITCQSVISGYLPNNRKSCGVDPADGNPDEPISNAIIDAQGLAGDPSDSSTSWTSPSVPVSATETTDHNLRFDVRETISDSYNSGDHVVRVFRNDDHTGSEGEILSSATPIYDNPVSDYDGGTWTEVVQSDRPVDDLPEKYHFLLCSPGSTVPDTCGIDNNIGHDTLTFRTPISNNINLDVKSPVVINPLLIDNIREDQLDVRTETLKIPDPSYDSSTWEIQNDGAPVIEGFSGTVTQEVTIEDAFGEKADRAQNGEILPEAVAKRSDEIPASEWEYEVSVTRTQTRNMVVPSLGEIGEYVESDPATWRLSGLTEPRPVQVDTEQKNFPIVNGDSFATRVEGQQRWYPLRNSGADRPETEFVFDTRTQRTDPDECLNCLTTETKEDANARLEASQGGLTEAIGTDGLTNAWEKVGEEPTIVNGKEVDSRFLSRSAIVSNTLTYDNFDLPENDRGKYRQRQSQKENIRLFQYEYSPESLEPRFERPITDQVQRYERDEYDITYTFSADVSNKDIYEYERTVRDDVIEYEDRHIAWVDLSRSSPTEQISQFEVQFEGADQPIVVDWIEGIHSLPPDERDSAIESECKRDPADIEGLNDNIDDDYPVSLGLPDQAFSEIERLDGLYRGNGGSPVVQKCMIDGEEKIVRIGQEYTDTGIFTYDVELVSNDEKGQGTVEVIGERPDRDGSFEPEIGSEPEISNLRAINKKVDYRIGTVPITGKITSQTNDLDGSYELTVTPADNIGASSVSCSEIGGGYRVVMNKTLTDSYPSGASFRQVEQCMSSEFGDPSQAPEKFELFRTYGGGSLTEASVVPEGAVQRCVGPFTQSSGNCVATIDSSTSETNVFEYQNSDGSYQPIGKYESGVPGIGYQCPAGYEMTREEQDADEKEDYSTAQVRFCQLKNPDALSIDLRSRTVNYQFESVSQGIVTECSEIPTVGQDGNHDGYVDSVAGSETANCQLAGDGEGPNDFTLYSTNIDSVTGESDVSYNKLPKGAFRAKSFVTGEEASECNDIRIEGDGSMICEYDTGSETVDVRFGTRDLGEWTSSSDTVSGLIDQTNARKSIWKGENIAPTTPGDYTEDFTTTINPRDAGVFLNQRDVEFTVELRRAVTGEVVQEETVEVRLCAAGKIQQRSDLPRDDKGEYECEDFDTMMTGVDDFRGERSISDAIEDYESGGLDGRLEEGYVINSVENNACPYTHEFPRDQSTLLDNTDEYTFSIQANNQAELRDERERIKQEIVNVMSAQYSPLGEDPCERVEGSFDIPTFVDNPKDFTIEFNKRTFANQEKQRFTRVAGLEDLHKIIENPVQNRWNKDDLGSAVRLGHPILLKSNTISPAPGVGGAEAFDVNEGLVAHYTFNHNTQEPRIVTQHSSNRLESSGTVTEATVPNHYVIQDVGMRPVERAPTGLETETDFNDLSGSYQSEGIYNARLWYGSPCHTAEGYDNGAIYNPEAVQPIDNGVGPRANSYAFNPEPCENILTSEEAQNQLGGKEFDVNQKAADYRRFSGGTGDGYSIGPSPATTLEQDVPENQASFLPVPPTENWQDEYSSTGRISNAYEAVGNNYAEKRGAFGGNALRLDKTSWMMIAPPCYTESGTGSDLSTSRTTNPGSFCGSSEGIDENKWRGGWQESYGGPQSRVPASSIQTQLGDEYTVSFWVNTKSERQSMSEVSADDGSSVAPLRSLYSTSLPVRNYEVSESGGSDIMPSTAELSLVKAPSYISIEDLPEESSLSGDRIKPVSWDYPGHFNLRDTARACTDSSLSSSSRPVMCKVFEDSNSEYASSYDDLTQYGDGTAGNYLSAGPFLEDFRNEMIDRTVWEPVLDWPVGNSVESGAEGFPAFDRIDFGTGELDSTGSCDYATQALGNSGIDQCYTTGRYAYSDYSGDVQADEGFGNSNWQHVAVSYNEGSTGGDFKIRINGQLKATPPADELLLESPQEDLNVGKLYQGSVMSIGAMYQDPGYDLNPNDLQKDGSFVPYIHASQGEVLIDEMRIYDRELGYADAFGNLPEPRSPANHELPANVPMYTGELVTEPQDEIPNGTKISELIGEDGFRTFEVEVEAGSDGPAAYEIDIIPCTSRTNCLTESSMTVSESNIPSEGRTSSTTVSDSSDSGSSGPDFVADGALGTAGSQYSGVQLTGTSEVVRLSGGDLTNSQVGDISHFKLDMTLGTPYVDSSPIIRNIKMTPSGDPFDSCQEIAGKHPGGQGLFGSEFSTSIIDSSGTVTNAKCDMKTAGGNWTRFAWADVSDGKSFSKDVESGDRMFRQDTELSECGAISNDVCFGTANWDEDVMDNIDSSKGPYPQVMIKAIDDNKVVDWAAFQLSENAHQVIGSSNGVSNVRVAGNLARVFSGDAPSELTGSGPSGTVGEPVGEGKLVSGSTTTRLYEECLHPFDNDGQFDRRCMSHVKQVESGGIQQLYMAEMGQALSPTSGGSEFRVNSGSEILRIDRDYEQNEIEDMSCAGREVDRCEFYYRVGDNFDPFGGESGVRKSAVLDPADYISSDIEEIDRDGPRGYTFSAEYDTKVTSLYSSYTGGSSDDWFIGIYSSDENGVIDSDGLVAGTSAPPAGSVADFTGNNINNKTLEAGEYYTIIQGKSDNSASGNFSGWSGAPDFDMSNLLGENPTGSFEPASSGKASVYASTDLSGLEGNRPILDSSRVPRIGFDYEVAALQSEQPLSSKSQDVVGDILDTFEGEDAKVGVRGFKINPDEQLRFNSLGMKLEFVTVGDYNKNKHGNIHAWGAIYETDASGNPSSVVASTGKIDSNDFDEGTLDTAQNFSLQSSARLNEGENYIVAVGSESIDGDDSTDGFAQQYVYRDNEDPIIGDGPPEVSWGSPEKFDIIGNGNQRALRWDVPDPTSPGDKEGSDPDYILDKSPDDTSAKYPPDIRFNYEYPNPP